MTVNIINHFSVSNSTQICVFQFHPIVFTNSIGDMQFEVSVAQANVGEPLSSLVTAYNQDPDW